MNVRDPGISRDSASFGLAELRIQGFRSLIDAELHPSSICALVGEAQAGKSNVLAAIRLLLDSQAEPPGPEDYTSDGPARIEITGRLSTGRRPFFEASAGEYLSDREAVPPVLFLPAGLRMGSVMSPPGRAAPRESKEAIDVLSKELSTAAGLEDTPGSSSTTPARALIGWVESWMAAGTTNVVLLVEEPELFLPPQLQRHLYHLLRDLADMGNQVIYSTHSPAFLNVGRMEELVLVERHPELGTVLTHPNPIGVEEEERAAWEFDAERSELFLARAAVLVEGLTEKLVLPLIFRALGRDPDRERVSIVECRGKSNIPLFVAVCKATGIPFVAVHDRDAPEGAEPNLGEQVMNQRIEELAGPDRVVTLVPDFEGIAGLRGHTRKPAHAVARFRGMDAADIPDSLRRVVELSLAAARD